MSDKNTQTLQKLLENYENQLATLREQQRALRDQTPDYVFEDIAMVEKRIIALREQLREQGANVTERTINTGGGSYIGGGVVTGGGDFIGRDKFNGDKVGGDKLAGDKISTGNVTGTGIAIGRGASSYVSSAKDASVLEGMFDDLMRAIYASSLAEPQKNEAQRMVSLLQNEVSHLSAADDRTVAQLIRDITTMAPECAKPMVSLFTRTPLINYIGPRTEIRLEDLSAQQ